MVIPALTATNAWKPILGPQADDVAALTSNNKD